MDERLAPLLQAVAGFARQIFIQTLCPQDRNGWNTEDFKTMSVPFDGNMPWYGRRLDSWLELFRETGLAVSKTIEPSDSERRLSIIFLLSAYFNLKS